MKFAIEKENAQRLLDYLQRQPYVDVCGLIPLLMAKSDRNPCGLEIIAGKAAESPDESS